MSQKLAEKNLKKLVKRIDSKAAQSFLALYAKKDTKSGFAADIVDVEVNIREVINWLGRVRKVVEPDESDHIKAGVFRGLQRANLVALEYVFDLKEELNK